MSAKENEKSFILLFLHFYTRNQRKNNSGELQYGCV